MWVFNQFNQVIAILECFFAKADKHYNIILCSMTLYFFSSANWTPSACDWDARIFSPADLAAHSQCSQWRAIHTVVICWWKLFFWHMSRICIPHQIYRPTNIACSMSGVPMEQGRLREVCFEWSSRTDHSRFAWRWGEGRLERCQVTHARKLSCQIIGADHTATVQWGLHESWIALLVDCNNVVFHIYHHRFDCPAPSDKCELCICCCALVLLCLSAMHSLLWKFLAYPFLLRLLLLSFIANQEALPFFCSIWFLPLWLGCSLWSSLTLCV